MSTLTSCILFWSLMNGISPSVTTAVISVESNGNPFAKGSVGEIGLMQIRAKYVPETDLQLGQSCTNVMRGTIILRKLKEKCKDCIDKTWIIAYNLGETGARKVKHKKLFPYYKKVITKLEE